MGHEKTLTGLLSALAGANIVFGLGMIEMGMTMDYGQLVLDNEFAEMIKNVVRGIPVNDEELSVDLIHEIGPFKDFISHESTLRDVRTHSYPKFIDRRNQASWVDAGCPDIYHKATEYAKDIIENYNPDPLSGRVLNAIQEIINEAEEEAGVPKDWRRKRKAHPPSRSVA
jgi:trimethylamine--corrinoid protein Co-methyltransferase